MIPPIVQRLRAATHEAHERLETRLDLIARVADVADRRRIVGRFLTHHRAEEADLGPWLAADPRLDFDSRRRTGAIARDLVEIGGDPDGIPTVPKAPATCRSEALGRFYVLEGSTLGGRVIARSLRAGDGDLRGLSFFDPYGPDSGEKWRIVLAVLDDEAGCSPTQADAIVRGAIVGFRLAEKRLTA